jgi:hypothetical protein
MLIEIDSFLQQKSLFKVIKVNFLNVVDIFGRIEIFEKPCNYHPFPANFDSFARLFRGKLFIFLLLSKMLLYFFGYYFKEMFACILFVEGQIRYSCNLVL